MNSILFVGCVRVCHTLLAPNLHIFGRRLLIIGHRCCCRLCFRSPNPNSPYNIFGRLVVSEPKWRSNRLSICTMNRSFLLGMLSLPIPGLRITRSHHTHCAHCVRRCASEYWIIDPVFVERKKSLRSSLCLRVPRYLIIFVGVLPVCRWCHPEKGNAYYLT